MLRSSIKFVSDFDVDFTSGVVDHRRRFGVDKGQSITKAVGLNKRSGLFILDSTAGFGQDAFMLASLSCTLFLCERVGFVRSLLKDGLSRAVQHPDAS